MSVVTPDPTIDENQTTAPSPRREVWRWSTRALLTVLAFGLLLAAFAFYAAQQTGIFGIGSQPVIDTTTGSGGGGAGTGDTVRTAGGSPGETGPAANVPGSTGSASIGAGAATGAGTGATSPMGGTSGNTSGGTTGGVPGGGGGTAGGFGGGR